MCGVAGVLSYSTTGLAIDKKELQTMAEVQFSRGPDKQNYWLSEDKKIGLAHQRLSIIDLSTAANQPMLDQTGRFVIVFNGEIYNFKELRGQCEQQGIQFRSHSDTEVLLVLYKLYAEKMLKMLQGMFALAIWDNKDESLFLARDPFGIKPLYYAENEQQFRFASQVRALQALDAVSSDKSKLAEASFLLFGTIPDPDTYYRDIKSIEAGSYMVIKDGRTHKRKFWIFSEIHQLQNKNNSKFKLREINQLASGAVSDSVKAHMVADVPVGLFLSSGLDSAAIAACMRQHSKQEIIAITLRYDEYIDTSNDETKYAKKIADHYQFKHHVYTVTKQEFEQEIPLLLQVMDQPTIDGINVWFVAKAAKKLGLKVALSGLGGDELFGGYPSFRNIPRWIKWCRVFSNLPFSKPVFKLLFQLFGRKVSTKAQYMLDYANDYAGAYLLQRGIYMPPEIQKFIPDIKSLFCLNWRQRLTDITKNIKQQELKISAMETCWYMRHQLLRDADWAGMAHSIEIRTPLVDRVLFETIAPYQRKIIKKTGKLPLANLLEKELAKQLLTRPKTGFTLPMKDWTQEDNVEENYKQHWSRSYVLKLHELFFKDRAI